MKKKTVKVFEAIVIELPPFSPEVADPGPQGEEPADEQAERNGRLFEQLHDDAGLSTFRLPVRGLQRPVVVFVEEEQRLAAGHRPEHLERRGGACEREDTN